MRNSAISIVLTWLAATVPGCIDADPSTFYVDGGSDAARDVIIPNDADDSGPVDPNGPCRECLAAPESPGPGCAGPLAACLAHEQCVLAYECAYELGCWGLPTAEEITTCGIPCFLRLGITDFNHPVVLMATAIRACVLMQCQPACGAKP